MKKRKLRSRWANQKTAAQESCPRARFTGDWDFFQPRGAYERDIGVGLGVSGERAVAYRLVSGELEYLGCNAEKGVRRNGGTTLRKGGREGYGEKFKLNRQVWKCKRAGREGGAGRALWGPTSAQNFWIAQGLRESIQLRPPCKGFGGEKGRC